jgi:AcrR family transcriptional regulator
MANETESAILQAASNLLEQHGRSALTTRAVCDAAGVKAPTLYHYFGDKDGLAAALVKQGLADFMAKKRAPLPSDDLMDQLRSGWDISVEFAVKRPHLYALLLEQSREHPELLAGSYDLMRARVQRLVDSGRFKLSVEESARAIWAANNGVLSVLRRGASRREIEAVSDLLFVAVTVELAKGR